jgi:hypothetical protein
MTNEQISKALTDIRPKAEFALTGDSLDGLEWLDKTQSKPTLAEIETAIANPLPEPELTVEQKLASVGLSIEELKAALGGN